MKVFEVYEVPNCQLFDFFKKHKGENIRVSEVAPDHITLKIPHDYTEAELHMFHLRKFAESGDARPEEIDACNYAINAIKTLQDMGVIAND